MKPNASFKHVAVCALALAAFQINVAAAPGSLDTTFNTTGKVTTTIGTGDERGNAVAVQADGKILVAGGSKNGSQWDFALARYNTNGSLDTTFNGTGKVTTDFSGATMTRPSAWRFRRTEKSLSRDIPTRLAPATTLRWRATPPQARWTRPSTARAW
jgi:uncharacterized delta-60 repeat protein